MPYLEDDVDDIAACSAPISKPVARNDAKGRQHPDREVGEGVSGHRGKHRKRRARQNGQKVWGSLDVGAEDGIA